MKYDRRRFQNTKSTKLYEEVINHKEIVDFRVFDYASLDQDGLNLFTDFMRVSIYRFCGFPCDNYP